MGQPYYWFNRSQWQGATTTVAAETIEQNQQLQEPEIKEIESPELIEAVKRR